MALVKITDGGANTLSFCVDNYSEVDMDFDKYKRATDMSLKHYEIGNKKIFSMSVRNISNSEYSTLKTIYDLRVELDFYRDSTGAKTADVIWQGNFDLHTPTEGSHNFIGTIYEGSIRLEEV